MRKSEIEKCGTEWNALKVQKYLIISQLLNAHGKVRAEKCLMLFFSWSILIW